MVKVLIIDDDSDFCSLTKKNLEARGNFVVSACSDGENGFNEVKRQSPDIVLIDIIMPVVSGAEIAEKIRDDEKTKKIPFVFLTAVVEETETDEYGDVIGGNYFVAKPVKIDKLIRTIEEILEKNGKDDFR